MLLLLASGFRNPGGYPKNPAGFYWVNPPKKPSKNPTPNLIQFRISRAANK